MQKLGQASQQRTPAVLVGYFPKKTATRPDWLENGQVQEICSVSLCLSPGPDDWISYWKHNDLGFYSTESSAYAILAGTVDQFDLYAYKLYPFRCRDQQIESIACPGIGDHDLSADYLFLGYDIVTKSTTNFFECSPLSCNNGARDFPVNRYCLIDDEATALTVLQAICQDGTYEPGPYYLFQVYRKSGRGTGTHGC